jgi:hypothetical protein
MCPCSRERWAYVLSDGLYTNCQSRRDLLDLPICNLTTTCVQTYVYLYSLTVFWLLCLSEDSSHART